MSSPTRRQSVLLGLFVSFGIVLIIVGLFSIGGLRELVTPKVTLSTTFPAVDGLTRGAAVWYSGVKVGTVKSIELTPAGEVGVRFVIHADAAPSIPADTVATISSDGLIGNTIISLGTGVSSDRLADGAVIPSTTSVGTEELMADIQRTNENLMAITSDLKRITGRVADGEGSIAKILRDDTMYDNLSATVTNLDAASLSARRTADDVASFASTLDDPNSLPRQITTDTTTYPLLKESVIDARNAVQTLGASADRVNDTLAADDTPLGVLLNDQGAGADLASTMETLDRSSVLLEEDLEALQHNFLLRRYFKKKKKREEKAREEALEAAEEVEAARAEASAQAE